MKKLYFTILALFAAASVGTALAIELELLEIDWSSLTTDMTVWYKSSFHLTPYIVAPIALIRLVWKGLDGTIPVLATALALGLALGVNGHLQGYLTGGLLPSLWFGLSAGGLAVGASAYLDRVLKQLRGGAANAALENTASNAAARLRVR